MRTIKIVAFFILGLLGCDKSNDEPTDYISINADFELLKDRTLQVECDKNK